MCVCSDMGKMQSDGGFIIQGRVADVMRFKVFAKVIYPTPIEEALGTHPSILDIQVRHKRNKLSPGVLFIFSASHLCFCMFPRSLLHVDYIF